MLTDKVETSIKEIIQEYLAGNKLELEIHIRGVNKDIFEQTVKGLLKLRLKAEIEHSISTVSGDPSGTKTNTRMIRRQIFHNGEKVADEYIQKTQLRNPPIYIADYLPYSIHLNRETEIRKFTSDQHATVRLRNRISFLDGNWRFDITAVKTGELKDIGPILKTLVVQFFPRNISPELYLSTIPYPLVDSYEIEIEYVGGRDIKVEDFNVVKKLFSVISPDYSVEIYMKKELTDIAALIKYNHPGFRANPTLKRLANQAVSLTKNDYLQIYPPVGYYLTDKADGVRCLVRGGLHQCSVVADHLIVFSGSGWRPTTPIESPKQPESLRREGISVTPTSRSPKDVKMESTDTTIVDGELICSGNTCTCYVFDVLMYRQDDVSGKPFSVRLDYLADAVKHLSEQTARFTNTSISDRYKNFTKINFVAKKFVRIEAENLENSFRQVWEGKHPYEIDGLILTSPSSSYHETTNYKWKPMEKNSIDFVAKHAPKSMLGKRPFIVEPGHDLYLLFVGINTEEQEKLGLDLVENYREIFPEVKSDRYHPIQFSPSSDIYAYVYQHPEKLGDIDGKIVELRREGVGTDSPRWVFIRVREDRKIERNAYYGNHFKVAELAYQNYVNPFPLEELWHPRSGYFTKTASDIYKARNSYMRFVISLLIRNHMSRAHWIIDLMSGRGADLHRYHEVGVKNALFVDKDAAAITELIQRKFDMVDNARKQARIKFNRQKTHTGGSHGVDNVSTSVYTMVADLTTPYEEMERRFSQFHFEKGVIDAIICNFGLHYLCDTSEHLRNILKLVSDMLRNNGVFVFTVLNGSRVFELLSKLKKGESWILKEGGVVKYELRRDFSTDRLTNVGQMISVRLPLADELYQEPLCNLDYVLGEAKKVGLALEINESFSQMLPSFEKARLDIYERLSPGDFEYIDLHNYVVVRKTK
jgi:hypothetical protein